MYYVNEEQIQIRLDTIPYIVQAASQLMEQWEDHNPVHHLAQERVLHLAIEIVTDVGSSLIDGFLMRDASSYEDIIEIISGEQVLHGQLADRLKEWVAWRKPLVQDYYKLERKGCHPFLNQIPESLPEFAEQVKAYISSQIY
ncbi:DUF86 domain-containing protein [Marinicrinis lubricantis]|uniref:DUF86 domain-containing protein n=1 Tax=Marinicrinis lubricantis TaxID=2086470 RepID=A0ABW1IT19_9BACL